MLERMRQRLERFQKWAARQSRRVRDLRRSVGARRERDQEERHQGVARAQFWADLREGQREAEAASTRRGP